MAIDLAYAPEETQATQTDQSSPPPLAYGDKIPTAPQLSDTDLSRRVARTDFALGDKSPGTAVLTDAFRNGQEGIVRETAAAQADAEFKDAKVSAIQQMQTQDKPISGDDVNTLMSIGNTPLANPDTVIEKKFSQNWTYGALAGDPGKNLVFQSAFNEKPQETQTDIKRAVGAGSAHHIVRGVLEDAQAAWDNMSGFDRAVNVAAETVVDTLTGGIASAINQRNLLTKGRVNTSILPGSNQLEQIQYLFLLPDEQKRATLMAAAGPGSQLWNEHPYEALNFIKSAVSFSASDAYINNVMGVANAASLLPFGLGAKVMGRLSGGRAVTAINPTAVASGIRTAEDVLRASSVPPKTAFEEGAAAAQKILRQSPNPSPAGYYMPPDAVEALNPVRGLGGPKAPVKGEGGPTLRPEGPTITVDKNGTPIVQTSDGAFVDLKRTPEEGHYPVKVTQGEPVNTYSSSRGQSEFVTENGKTTVGNQNTIFVDQKSYEKLSNALDPEKNLTLLNDDKGFFVGDLDNTRPGKEVRGTRVSNAKISNEPAPGLYPIHLREGSDRYGMEDFGTRIGSVQKNNPWKVEVGPRIATQTEVDTKQALADIAKAQTQTDVVDAMSLAGHHETAATMLAQRNLQNRFDDVAKLGDVEAIRRNVPSLASPQTFFQNSASLSAERARRLADNAVQTSSEIGAALTDPQRVERLTAEALNRAIDAAKDVIRTKFNRNADAILDQSTIWDSASNTYRVQSKLGKKDGTLFDSRANAEHYRTFQYRLGSSATVEQEGTKFYLSHIQHADETRQGVRDGLIVSENQTPKGFWNTMLSGLTGKLTQFGYSVRSSRYTQSEFQMNNRIAATHAPSVLRGVIEDAAKDLEAMGGKWTTGERQELQRILEHNRDFMHEDGQRGLFYKSAFEFETAFHDMFGKMPTEKQIAAYDQFTRISDLDWVLRELDWHRDAVRQGIRNYQIPYTKIDQDGIPSPAKTDWFRGKKVEDFDPANKQNANIYVLPEQRYEDKFSLTGKVTQENKDTMDKIKDGRYTIIQVANPGGKPLKEATGIKENIHFVVVDKYDNKALQFGEFSTYRPGGHVIYQDPLFLKVPQIGPGAKGALTHYGDITVKSFATPKEAAFWADRYNTARKFLEAGDEAGLDAYIAAGHLPEATTAEFKKMFTEGGFGLDAKHPFVVTTSGRNTFQSSEELSKAYPGLKDTFSSYDLTQTQDSTFLAERDRQLNTIANVGSEDNPVYSNVPSRLYDPYTALQKGVSQIVRQRWMGDYKISAAESWVQEFGHLFDQNKLPIEKLRQNPTYWMYHAQGNIDQGMAKTQPEMFSAAMVSRQNILNFIGARDEVGAVIEGIERMVTEKVEGIAGKRAAQFVEEKLLPGITSIPEYTRKAAFHSVIGLFNPVQLFQQAQGMAHVLALSPLNGLKGTTASALARMYRYTEDAAILGSMADKAAAMGWNRDHFLEAWQAWKASGTHTVGGETALLSSAADPKLFQSTAGWLLDKGLMFFKAGESVVRDTAYFTAYQDWRAANPMAKLDNRAMGDIGNRFDTLSMNMTRASNAAYNEGIASIPTQFWTWNARLTEQMLGKQLTWGEKASVFAMYSTLYGVPATLGGVTFGVIPYMNYGDIRQYALVNNINVSNKWFQSFSEGLPAMLTNLVTGHDTDFQRFSPNASQLKDILDGKKTALETFGGASGGFVQKMMNSMYPAYMYGFNAFKKDGGFPLHMNDLANWAESVSTFNNGEKMYYGLSLGQYVGKNENLVVGNIDKFEAVLLGLGLNPKRASDAYAILDYAKQQKAAQESIGKRMTEDWKIAMRAGARGDIPTMVDYMKRVQIGSAAGNFTKAQEIDLFKKSVRGDSSDLIDAANRWMLTNNKALQSVPEMRQYFENQKNRR